MKCDFCIQEKPVLYVGYGEVACAECRAIYLISCSDIPYDTIQKGRTHPSPFPVALAEHCIKISGGEDVIDPFVGCGSSAKAAKRCGSRYFVGIDIDSKYVKEARKA